MALALELPSWRAERPLTRPLLPALAHRLPIGPIGAHLSLEDTRWAKAAEVALGPHLNKWICHSHKDAQV